MNLFNKSFNNLLEKVIILFLLFFLFWYLLVVQNLSLEEVMNKPKSLQLHCGLKWELCTLDLIQLTGETQATCKIIFISHLFFPSLTFIYRVGRVLQSLITGLTVGFSFWKIGNSSSDVNLYVLAIVHIIMLGKPRILFNIVKNTRINISPLGLTLIFAAMPQFCRMKELFKRDYASKYYSSMPFSVSAIVVEIPYLVILLLYFCFNPQNNLLTLFR